MPNLICGRRDPLWQPPNKEQPKATTPATTMAGFNLMPVSVDAEWEEDGVVCLLDVVI